MKKKITIITWLFILIAVFCSACGSSDNAADTPQDSTTESAETESTEDKKTEETEPKEEKLYGEKTLDEIKEDLGTSEIMMNFGTDEDYYISDITLIKRNTKAESDNVFCTITVNGDTRQFIQDFELVYNHYTTGGWILDEYAATSEQTVLPLTGVDDYVIGNVIEQNISADCDFEIIKHETTLEPDFMSDSVSVTVSLEKNLFHASGTLTIDFMFNGSFWEFLEISKENDYMEIWDVDGTWILDESEGDTGYIHILQFWHNDDMTISGNKYSIGFTFGKWHDEVPRDFDNVLMDFNTVDGYIEVENAATYVAKLDEDGIYRTVWGFPDDKSHVYEKISTDVLSIDEIKNLISLQ